MACLFFFKCCEIAASLRLSKSLVQTYWTFDSVINFSVGGILAKILFCAEE